MERTGGNFQQRGEKHVYIKNIEPKYTISEMKYIVHELKIRNSKRKYKCP